MLLWHVVLIPLVLVALVGAHVLAVRVRGVVHPLPVQPRPGQGRLGGRPRWPTAPRGGARPGATTSSKRRPWPRVVAVVLVVALAGLLSSPDVPPVTVASWAKIAPADFVATAASELAGTSETATYGPPYTNSLGQRSESPLRPGDYRRRPPAHQRRPDLRPVAAGQGGPHRSGAGRGPRPIPGAPPAVHAGGWNNAYANAVTKVTFRHGTPVVPAAADGPIPAMLATELTLARSGAIDADLLANHAFYGTDFTKPLLFLEDGQYFSNLATAEHLTGAQWGVMNETGSYPGQPWLWLYTLWYQVPGFDNSANVDLIAIYLTGVATILLLAVPVPPRTT